MTFEIIAQIDDREVTQPINDLKTSFCHPMAFDDPLGLPSSSKTLQISG